MMSKNKGHHSFCLIGNSSKEAFPIKQKHSVGCALARMEDVAAATVLGAQSVTSPAECNISQSKSGLVHFALSL